MDILAALNEEQRKAVTTTEGYVRVIAGAGSGKTRALSHRFAYLVNQIGIMPGNILCVTFTNKAANEMRQRIHRLTGDNDTGYVNTFHGFCVSILQEDSYALQYPKSFLVLDNSDIDEMLQLIYDERGLTLRDMTFSNARDMFEIRKIFKEPEYYTLMLTLSTEKLHDLYMKAQTIEDILFYGYLYQEKKCFGLDYNDLIIFSLYIFETHDDIRLKWQQRLEYIMIDEFQDIDSLQYRLMTVLCSYHQNLFIVGDPDQTIYTWRGANVKYLLDFDKAFPGTKTIMMNKNYRSSPQIIKATNTLIATNTMRIKKELVPTCDNGTDVLCHLADDAKKEADWVVSQIMALQERGIDYSDMTVLYRAHYISRILEETLMKKKIPYVIYSGVPFFGRREIKDALSYLRMITYEDDLSFLRVCNTPKRNVGKKRIAYLKEYAAQHRCSLYEALRESLDDTFFKGTKAASFVNLIDRFHEESLNRPVSEVMADLMEQSGYEAALRTEGSQERLDNLAELKQSIYDFETTCGEECTLEYYISHIALLTNSDTAEPGNRIKLMTIHAAKGLEFPYVFLYGISEGMFPSRRVRTWEGMEEERRLAFVAMTRAEKGLFLSSASGLTLDGSIRYPSRFIFDMGDKALTFTPQPSQEYLHEAKEVIESKNDRLYIKKSTALAFHKGDRIRHDVFGEGKILSIHEGNHFYEIQFDSLPTKRKISFRVHLTKV